ALACGTLVITNGAIGAEETFQGKLPIWTSAEELNDLIEFYLDHEDARMEKIKELQEFVLANHTYSQRADYLKRILKVMVENNNN
ncbi:MAG TPA: glycosyltransferase, partial [Methanobacterium sp.]